MMFCRRTKAASSKLEALIVHRGRPLMVVSDSGTELTSRAILHWRNTTLPEHRPLVLEEAPGVGLRGASVRRKAGLRVELAPGAYAYSFGR
jgi:hypothetical protein